MSTQNVIKVRCDRCQRIEEKPAIDPPQFLNPTAGMNTQLPVTVLTPPSPAFEGKLMLRAAGETDEHPCFVKFQDLCEPCRRTVSSLLDQIGRRIDGLSPDRKVAKRGAKKEVAAVSSSATSHSSTPQRVQAHPPRG